MKSILLPKLLVSFKTFVKNIIFSLFLYIKILLQKIEMKRKFFWKGVYEEYDHVEISKNSWGEGILEKEYCESLKNYIKHIDRKSFIPMDISEEYILLPFLSASYTKGKSEITILDFGGALGISYIQLKRCLVRDIKVQYHIVETEAMINYSKEIHYSDSDIYFHNNIIPHNHDY